VLHVVESDVLAGEDTVDLDADSDATELLRACIAELREAGVPVTGEVLHSFGTHADVADQILRRTEELGAGAIVIGPESRHGVLGPGVTARIAEHAPIHVVVLHPAAGALGRPLAAALND
jgi:nucleotide-binding universal stress UspA family protein